MEIPSTLANFLNPAIAKNKVIAAEPVHVVKDQYYAPHITDLFERAISVYRERISKTFLSRYFFSIGAFRLLQRENGEFLENFYYKGDTYANIIGTTINNFDLENNLTGWKFHSIKDYSQKSSPLIDILADFVKSREEVVQENLDIVELAKRTNSEEKYLSEYFMNVFPINLGFVINPFYPSKKATTKVKDILDLELAIKKTRFIDIGKAVSSLYSLQEFIYEWKNGYSNKAAFSVLDKRFKDIFMEHDKNFLLRSSLE